MAHLSNEVISEALKMDLLTYLSNYEPYELVRVSHNVYSTRTHDSLRISNGKWIWWSRGIGGYNAVDYLVKVKGMKFIDAVERITGKCVTYKFVPPKPKKDSRLLILPKKCNNTNRIEEYLFSRGIDIEIIRDCVNRGIVYECLPYHNVIFVGKDKNNVERYGAYRATNETRIMGDCSGSDKHYSFKIKGKSNDTVHVFESAIDALSFATLLKLDCKDWKRDSLLSLAGVYAPGNSFETSKLPAALEQYLLDNEGVNKICLHLDNDRAGRFATKVIEYNLSDEYEIVNETAPHGKDINDFLCFKLGINKKKERSFER